MATSEDRQLELGADESKIDLVIEDLEDLTMPTKVVCSCSSCTCSCSSTTCVFGDF